LCCFDDPPPSQRTTADMRTTFLLGCHCYINVDLYTN